MAEDVFFEYPANQYHEGIALNLFKGEYSLVNARDKNGEIFMEWCYPQRDRKPIDKSLPWKVKLGDGKDNAIEMLRGFIKALQGTEEVEQKAEEDEIPF